MPRPRNALWIMCDQLRFDYLGCAGHPTLRTPAIDRLSSRGVRFEHAYAQSPCCGPSRMSAYTGRYVRSHGATCNGFPLRVDERTVGDYLRPLGVRPLLIGKSHVAANEAAMDWLGIERDSAAGRRIVHGGFESLVRHDGEFMPDDSATDYHAYLRRCGFEGRNLWEEWAATAQGERGERLVGAFYENADKPARVSAGHSESAFITGRAEEFIESEGVGSSPWMMHLSYIKPHWPYLAPAPYHARYAAGDVVPANRVEGELEDPHPLIDAFMRQNYSRVPVPDAVRRHVIPAYMGLVAEVDDMIARVLACLRRTGLLDSTLIVLSADHGDYLGDHWLGEKYLFHDPSVRLPFIVVDPSAAAERTRGSVSASMVELIDVVPTLVEWFGGQVPAHLVEGRSLLPELHDPGAGASREFVVSEYDFSFDLARHALGSSVATSRATMVADRRYKLWQVEGAPPLLFDRAEDPAERVDLGRDPARETVRRELSDRLFEWARTRKSRTTIDDATIRTIGDRSRDYDAWLEEGYYIGYWNQAAVDEELAKRDRGGRRPPHP